MLEGMGARGSGGELGERQRTFLERKFLWTLQRTFHTYFFKSFLRILKVLFLEKAP
jgi:hypothetical protein